jgi:hypothetical protein
LSPKASAAPVLRRAPSNESDSGDESDSSKPMTLAAFIALVNSDNNSAQQK